MEEGFFNESHFEKRVGPWKRESLISHFFGL